MPRGILVGFSFRSSMSAYCEAWHRAVVPFASVLLTFRFCVCPLVRSVSRPDLPGDRTLAGRLDVAEIKTTVRGLQESAALFREPAPVVVAIVRNDYCYLKNAERCIPPIGKLPRRQMFPVFQCLYQVHEHPRSSLALPTYRPSTIAFPKSFFDKRVGRYVIAIPAYIISSPPRVFLDGC
jgi:hypothetical protein